MYRRKSFARTMACGVVCVVMMLTACGSDDSTDLGDTSLVDPEATQAVDSIVSNFFEGNDGLESLNLLGALIAGITGVTGSAPELAVDGRAAGRRLATRALAVDAALLTSLAGSDPRPTVPVELLGVTCIWDSNLQQYIVDPNDPGLAPANGIRFRLYTTSSVTGIPVLPLDDIGFLDIIDSSSGQVVDVSLLVNIKGVPVLDYDVTGSFSVTSFNINTAGTISDGVSSLNFDLAVSGTASAFTAAFALVAGPATFSLSVTLDPTGAGSATASLSSGVNTLAVTVTFDENGFVGPGGVVTLNGDVVADISGNLFSPLITPTPGSPLSSQDAQALSGVFLDGVTILEALTGLAEAGLAIGGNTPPGSDVPIITGVSFPSIISGTPGDSALGTVSFLDPDGDIVLARFDVVSSALVFTPFSFDPFVQGSTSGSFGFLIFCSAGGGPCSGATTLQVTLTDADGNVSLPFRFSFSFGGAAVAAGAEARGTAAFEGGRSTR